MRKKKSKELKQVFHSTLKNERVKIKTESLQDSVDSVKKYKGIREGEKFDYLE